MIRKAKNLILVILGTLAIALSLDLFLAPGNIAPGGVSGLSIVINHLVDIPLGVLMFALNIPIFLLGLKYFNRRFLLYSLGSMLLLSVFTDLFANIPQITNDLLLCAIYGGASMGLGLGLIFSAGCTTGGSDIVVQILKQKYPSISIGRFFLIIDTVVIVFAGLVSAKLEVVLYSAISIYICTILIDLIVEGNDATNAVYIISNENEKIAEQISDKLDRGTTILHGSSFYSKEAKQILLCVVRKHQISMLKTIVKDTDPLAFVIFLDARQVLGKGFDSNF